MGSRVEKALGVYLVQPPSLTDEVMGSERENNYLLSHSQALTGLRTITRSPGSSQLASTQLHQGPWTQGWEGEVGGGVSRGQHGKLTSPSGCPWVQCMQGWEVERYITQNNGSKG